MLILSACFVFLFNGISTFIDYLIHPCWTVVILLITWKNKVVHPFEKGISLKVNAIVLILLLFIWKMIGKPDIKTICVKCKKNTDHYIWKIVYSIKQNWLVKKKIFKQTATSF